MMIRLIAAVCAALGLTAAALAHAGLKSSSIEDGATLDAAPASITLEFTAEVGLAAIGLETADGTALETGFSADRRFATVHTAELPDVGSGDYVLEWRALARDGHVMTGEIEFSVALGDA
ncbi:copper resistance protein CopC [Maricaulaceae bacterium NA33B04]|nr:copper resistance protein CopC [Maricaulaceae bacterium NA33B04]